jgi:hypothetical protein
LRPTERGDAVAAHAEATAAATAATALGSSHIYLK